MLDRIKKLCQEKGVKFTKSRAVIAKVVSQSDDHPDVDEVWRRASKIDSNIGIATVYRTLKLFEESGIITRHEFGKNKAHYEFEDEDEHHDHLINVENGEI